jgi:lipopolysaccharide export system protein LptA
MKCLNLFSTLFADETDGLSRLPKILWVCFLCVGILPVYAQPINVQGDKLTFESGGGRKLQHLEGNVTFEQGGNVVRCDKAVFDVVANRLNGNGNVRVTSNDGMTVTGDLLEYDGNTKVARVDRNVLLTDREMTLRTPSVSYNTQTKVGYYTGGGHILSGEIDLRSGTGSYNSANRMLYFRRNVLLKHPEYTMQGDTLQYNTQSRTAWFFGPTTITSEDNTIVCRKGWYNTASGKSHFSDGVVIYAKENTLSADTMSFNRNNGVGMAGGNIVMRDTAQGFTIFGDRGWYNRNTKFSRIYGEPYAQRSDASGDTLFIKADTFFYAQDTAAGYRTLSAYHRARILQGDFAGRCDSLIYQVDDSLFRLYGFPMLWSENNQLSGDTMRIFLRNRKIHRMELRRESFVITREDSLHFSQIAGRDMDQWFGHDNKMRLAHVRGQGQSVYFMRENDSLLTGVNIINCENMTMYFDSGRVSQVRFFQKPEGNVYPMEQIPNGADRLLGFNWNPADRPLRAYFVRIAAPPPVKTPEPAVQKPATPARRKR